ncbi:MAG TPA: DUF2252 domain-containing protein [Gaiellaceae bacterium]|nr:DUF2252 domain-containing protein [Gaiellaceae bacterium]
MDLFAQVEHPSVDERTAIGRGAREALPRADHAALEPRDRDPVELLEAQAKPRVEALLPIRYGRMVASPFAFYRGAAAIMADDLDPLPRSGLKVQLCGDAHLLNFGGYASPERDLVFGINDFDETLPGPFEWDVKRLATSVEIAGRDRRFKPADRATAVSATVRAYRDTMRELSAMKHLEVWYARSDVASLVAQLNQQGESKPARGLEREAARAPLNDRHALAKLFEVVDGEPRLLLNPPLTVPVDDVREDAIRDIYRTYRKSIQSDRRALLESFRYCDLARRVVGVGSVGLRAWIILLVGRDETDTLILQLKQAEESVLEPYLGKGAYASHAQRVVRGQRVSQSSSDIFLGWTQDEHEDGQKRDYYVRQLRDWKLSVDIPALSARALAVYGGWCGAALARAHARSGDRIAIASYLGKGDAFVRAVGAFATAYANVSEADHAALVEAVQDGRVQATTGI